MANIRLREKARALRARGKSLSEIANLLRASKSTVSHWCRDILLSNDQLRSLSMLQARAGAYGRIRAAEAKRASRIKSAREAGLRGAGRVGRLTPRDLYILGLGLYWGEGLKSANEEFGISNSDPAVIRTFIKWVESAFGIARRDLILRVSLNAVHAHRVSGVEQFWSHVTGVPLSQFTKTSLITTSSRKVYPANQAHYGTLRVKVRRATNLHRTVLGSLAELRRQAGC
jgi:transcriptional regulator with XRE-family HTH domain